MVKQTYSDKLRNPKWQKKRLEILNRDNFACTMCNDNETELQVHHLKYTKEPWDAPSNDLKTVCKYCHYILTYLPDRDKIKYIYKYRDEKDKHIVTTSIRQTHLFKIIDGELRYFASMVNESDSSFDFAFLPEIVKRNFKQA